MRSATITRFLYLFAALNVFFWGIVVTVGCTTAWTTEAVNIIKVLIPAIESVLGLLAALGTKVPPTVASDVESWGQQTIDALNNQIAPLIEQFQNAEASAKPGLLTEIQTAIDTVNSNLKSLLSTIHISDTATQAKIIAVANAISAELQALVNMVPVLQGKVHLNDVRQLPLDDGHFVQQFNRVMVEPTGNKEVDAITPNYQIGDKLERPKTPKVPGAAVTGDGTVDNPADANQGKRSGRLSDVV
jgi:hypothetical protein